MHPRIAATLRYVLSILILGLVGWLVLPVIGYMAGKRVIGAYEGRLGLRDYMDHIHAGVDQGEPLALLIVLAPLLIAMVWTVLYRVGRRVGSRRD